MDKTSHPRVLHIASGDLWAGAEAQLFTLAKTLHNKLGIYVSVVLLNTGTLEQRLRNAGIQIIVIDESKLNSFQILYMLIRIIRKHNPDVIHTHRLKENILGSIAALLSGGIPTLRTAHGAPEHRPSWRQILKRLIFFLDRFCGRYLQKRIVAVSGDLADILQKNFPAKKISVIENGLDLKDFNTYSNKLNHDSKTQQDTFKIGLAGRLVAVKRVDLFIKTARYLIDHYPDLKTNFHIYGDGPLRAELEKISQELETDGIVSFEGHCDDLPERLQHLDILLMTSDHEGLPMVLLEAMALGTPIIANAVGGIPKLLDQGSCGVLVWDNNASTYAKKISWLANNPSNRSEIIQKARNRLIKYYSAEHNAKAYHSEYMSVCQ